MFDIYESALFYANKAILLEPENPGIWSVYWKAVNKSWDFIKA